MLLYLYIKEQQLSQQNIQFKFPLEEKPFVRSYNKESLLNVKTSCAFVTCMGLVFIMTSVVSTKSDFKRTPQNIKNISSPLVSQSVGINPFFIFLQSTQGSQLTKINISFKVSNYPVLNEIKKSSLKIKNHLIFILSSKNISTFLNQQEFESLKQEIIMQLNLFLVTGTIKNIKLTKTFLN